MTEREKRKFKLKGRLRIKDNYYHTVIDTKHPLINEIIRHSQSTKLKVKCETKREEKENRELAEEKLIEFQKKWTKYYLEKYLNKKVDITFDEYLWEWLDRRKNKLTYKTVEGYKTNLRRVDKYFKDKNILLEELTMRDLQKFYKYCEDVLKISNNTIIKVHTIIKSALETARREELIIKNVAEYVEKFKKEKITKKYLKEDEIYKILETLKENKIYTVTFLAAKYGFRRSEALGLRWSDIDFDRNTITVRNSVVEVENKDINAKYKKKQVNREKLKTNSSFRVLPLLFEVKEFLLKLKEITEENKQKFKNSYNYEYSDNICVDSLGNLIKLDYVTKTFKKAVNKLKYEDINFHTLRHSVATLLHQEGLSLKVIQCWLGHSNISTTADIYTHLSLEDLSEVASIFNKQYVENKKNHIHQYSISAPQHD